MNKIDTLKQKTSQNSKKYALAEEAEKDSTLNIIVPDNTSYEQIKDLFKKYQPFTMPKAKEPHYYWLFFGQNQTGAMNAFKELQYKKVCDDEFIVISNGTIKKMINEEGRLYIITDEFLDPRKLHNHFEQIGKLAHIRRNAQGYFVQYYFKEDRDMAYFKLKDAEFEGSLLNISVPVNYIDPGLKNYIADSSEEFDNSKPTKPKQKLSSKNLIISEDEFPSISSVLPQESAKQSEYIHEQVKKEITPKKEIEQPKKEISPKKEIEQPKKIEQVKIEQVQIVKVKIEEKIPRQVDEKTMKIIAKLGKQLLEVVKDEKIVELLKKGMEKFDKDTLVDYLSDDEDWIVKFFEKLVE